MARPARRLQPARPARAVVYCRVSTDEQGDSGLGLEAQEADLPPLGRLRGVEVVAVTSTSAPAPGPRPTGPDSRPRWSCWRPGGGRAGLRQARPGDPPPAWPPRPPRPGRGARLRPDPAGRRPRHLHPDRPGDPRHPVGGGRAGTGADPPAHQGGAGRQARPRAAAGAGAAPRPRPRRWIVEQVERHGRSRKGLAADLNAPGRAHRHRPGPLAPVDDRRRARVSRLRAGAVCRPHPRRGGRVGVAARPGFQPRSPGLSLPPGHRPWPPPPRPRRRRPLLPARPGSSPRGACYMGNVRTARSRSRRCTIRAIRKPTSGYSHGRRRVASSRSGNSSAGVPLAPSSPRRSPGCPAASSARTA